MVHELYENLNYEGMYEQVMVSFKNEKGDG
jgi:hypothetical protein